jgi:hypothetical protein
MGETESTPTGAQVLVPPPQGHFIWKKVTGMMNTKVSHPMLPGKPAQQALSASINI